MEVMDIVQTWKAPSTAHVIKASQDGDASIKATAYQTHVQLPVRNYGFAHMF